MSRIVLAVTKICCVCVRGGGKKDWENRVNIQDLVEGRERRKEEEGRREADIPSEGSAFSMTLLHMSSMYLSLTS